MVWPRVTELPRNLEPTGEDPFVRDLDERDSRARPMRPGVHGAAFFSPEEGGTREPRGRR